MNEFPEFMKRKENLVSTNQQNTKDVEGYYYEGEDGSQMAFWTHYSDRVSEKHSHEFDEYMICVNGKYIVYMNDKEYNLNSGDELLIPKGAEHWGKCDTGTRTIHAFGGRRIHSEINN